MRRSADFVFSKGKAEEGMRTELEAIKQLLQIQQSENYHAQDHIEILGNELDSVRDLLEQKQKNINELISENSKKNDVISNLTNNISTISISQDAFNELDQLNKALLEKLKEKQQQIDELTIELRMEREIKEDKTIYEETNIKKLAAMDIIVSSRVRVLEETLLIIQEELEVKNNLVNSMSEEIKILKDRLLFNDELRAEQITRSRQSEYRTLSKLEEVSINYNKLKDDADILQDTIKINSMRGDLLQVQLNNVVDDFDNTHEVFASMINIVESNNNDSRIHEKLLIKDNEKLQNELNVTKNVLNKVLENHKKNISLTPFDASLTKILDSQNNNNHNKEIKELDDELRIRNSVMRDRGIKTSHVSSSNSKQIGSYHMKTLIPIENAQNATFPKSNSENALSLLAFSPTQKASKNQKFPYDNNDSNRIDELLVMNVPIIKYNIISKYMKLIVDIQTNKNISTSIDLNNCNIEDEDLNKIIEWWRLISLTEIQLIDMHNNVLSGDGFDKLVVWLISLPPQDLFNNYNKTHLLIDLKHNRISKDSVDKGFDLLNSHLHNGNTNLIFENEVIYIYYSSNNNNKETSKLILKIDLKYQSVKPSNLTFVNNSLDIKEPPKLDDNNNNNIIPRDSILLYD